MKNDNRKAATILILLLVLLSPAAGTAFSPLPKAEGIDVLDLFENPPIDRAVVKVRGVVMSADPAGKTFRLIDYREYRSCRSIECPNEWLTIVHAGKAPGKEAVVEATGVLEKNPEGKGGLILRATLVTVR